MTPSQTKIFEKVAQVHILRPFANARLNGDAYEGKEKSCIVGGYRRGRWSSQSQKFRVREILKETLPNLPQSYRSKHLIRDVILERVLELPDVIHEDLVHHSVGALAFMVHNGPKKTREKMREVIATIRKNRTKKKGKIPEIPDPLECSTGKDLFFSGPELEYLYEWAVKITMKAHNDNDVISPYMKVNDLAKKKSWATNFAAIGSGLADALCGRAQTGDLMSRVDASLAVSHAFTVHEWRPEHDYFAIVDDLTSHNRIFPTPLDLTSAIYYQYAIIDLDTLASNLQADRVTTVRITKEFVKAFSRISGARFGSTASASRPLLTLLELSSPHDCYNYADAFLQPCGPSPTEALNALSSHIERAIKNYGRDLTHAWMCAYDSIESLQRLGYQQGSFQEMLDGFGRAV